MHEPLTSLYAVIAIQFARGTPETEIWRALHGAASLHRFAGKWIIAVDEDIEPDNADALVLGDVLPLPAAARPQASFRTRTRATGRAARATAARPRRC